MSGVDGTVVVLSAESRTRGIAAALAWALALWRVVAAAGLAVLTGLVLWSLLPLGFGWGSHVVLSDSMAPGITTGDVVVAQPAPPADVLPGQVILFTDPAAQERTVVHRFLRYDAAGLLVTRGDANQSEDSTALDPAHVRALPRLLIPWVGQPATWLRHGRTAPLAASAVIGLLGVLAVATVRTEDDVPLLETPQRFALGSSRPAGAHSEPAAARPPEQSAVAPSFPVRTAPHRAERSAGRGSRRGRPQGAATWSTPFPAREVAR